MTETNENEKLDGEPTVTAAEATAEEAKETEEAKAAEDAKAAEGAEKANEAEETKAKEEAKDTEEKKEDEKAEPDYQAQLAELQDKYLRKLAEFDNYRKRMAREFNEAREQARRMTVTDFLTVYDYFAMGMSAIETAPDVNMLKQGMEMIWAEFQRVLEGLNVKEIESVGKPFDANLHEAMSQEASETVPEGVVIRQWKAGFKIGDKLLRPATVVVSSGKPEEKKSEGAEESAPEADKPAEGENSKG